MRSRFRLILLGTPEGFVDPFGSLLSTRHHRREMLTLKQIQVDKTRLPQSRSTVVRDQFHSHGVGRDCHCLTDTQMPAFVVARHIDPRALSRVKLLMWRMAHNSNHADTSSRPTSEFLVVGLVAARRN